MPETNYRNIFDDYSPPQGAYEIILQQDTASLKSDVAELKQEVKDLRHDVSDIKGDIKAIIAGFGAAQSKFNWELVILGLFVALIQLSK